jgi:crotonobetainyl-CoA:carnitine CoA-transferase CaiB-like acyl-CoA transferase
MADVMFHLQDQLGQHVASAGAFRPKRVGRHHPMYCPVGTYRLPEGFGFVLVLDRQWPNLLKAMDRADLADDPRFTNNAQRARNQAELIPIVQDWLLSFPDNEALVDVCRQHRVPLGPVMEPADAIGHPHFEARGMVRRVSDPVAGEIVIPGFPWKFSAQPDLPDLEAPTLGQHNGPVLRELLGYSDARIEDLTARGVLRTGIC